MTPNDLGTFLVEDCQKIALHDYLTQARTKLKALLLSAELSIMDTPVRLTTSKTQFGGTRFWFECPTCGKRAGTLFSHPITSAIGCRKCLGLEYRKQRYKAMD